MSRVGLLVVLLLLLLVRELKSFPIAIPTEPSTESESNSTCQPAFEEDGKFTGDWKPNTLTSFNRTLAVFKICFSGQKKFVKYVDEDSNLDMNSLNDGDIVTPLNRTTHCHETAEYIRDCRSNRTQNLTRGSGKVVFLRPFNSSLCGVNGCVHNSGEDPTYPLNLDAIWQVEVPKNHGAVVFIERLEIEQAEDGACSNDYITIYGDNDTKTPTKMCGNVNSQRFLFLDGRTSRVYVKFQSNHKNNKGHFRGGIYVFLSTGNGSGSSGTEDAASRRRRSVHSEVSGAGANPGKVMTDDSNGDNWDETSDSLADKTLDSYVPLVNGELEDEVVDCFHTIVSHGHLGAQKYLNSLAHPICRLFARKFEKNGYVSPVV